MSTDKSLDGFKTNKIIYTVISSYWLKHNHDKYTIFNQLPFCMLFSNLIIHGNAW